MLFRNLILILSSILVITSCCKEELATAFYTPKVNVYVSIDNKIQNGLEKDIDEHLLYNWSREDGDLYYSHGPEKVHGNIVNLTDEETISRDFNVFSNNFFYLDYRKQYDLYLFNDSSMFTTCEHSEQTKNFKFDNSYEPIKQCKEYGSTCL